MKRTILSVLVVMATCLLPVFAEDADLAHVLARFDRVQENVRTLSAEFTETTESALLTDVIVARGQVYLTKPDSVRWEYSAPEEMRFVIREDTYTGYFPAQKRAERRDIARWREQLFRFLGLGQASTELAKFYDISLGDPGPGMDHTWLLVMDPKKKRVRKRMEAVRFWISRESSMPVRIEYRSRSGNRRVVEFERMLVNPELSASLYIVEIPDDVKIGKGFSALSGFSASGD